MMAPQYIEDIRALLKAKHGRQTEIAQATGIPIQSIRNFVAGAHNLSPERLDMVAKQLGLRIALIAEPKAQQGDE